jgi:putative nucleotidyltransferase with HDIG domain
MQADKILEKSLLYNEFLLSCNGCPCLPDYSKLLHDFATSLGKALDARDNSTKEHSCEVADISSIIGKSIGLRKEQLEVIHLAGHLHDIGKIGIPDHILFKEDKLTSEEWECIKNHPVVGAGIVSSIEGFTEKNSIKDIIMHHHERYDGKGYPNGLKGNQIPLGARIIAVADSISAMMQNRPYRRKMDYYNTVNEVFRNSGSQFDPLIVNAFSKNMEIIENYLERKRE